MSVGKETAVLNEQIEKICKQPVIQGIDQPVIEVLPENLIENARLLKCNTHLSFNVLLDICAVDYFAYGNVDWETNQASYGGYERAQLRKIPKQSKWDKPRFAVVYHLLSTKHNHRLRLKVYVDGETGVDSVSDIWPSALWYEREAFDLFGIHFNGHPDLRRILTDYGFVGHPMRKDFPLIGHLEMRYDASQAQCIYEDVSIEYHSHVPRVIRSDSRYSDKGEA